MDKISKLSKEVKIEVNEMKKIKTELSQLKKEVCGIRQSEEDLTNIGKDSISRLNEEFKNEVEYLNVTKPAIIHDNLSTIIEQDMTSDEEYQNRNETENEKEKGCNEDDILKENEKEKGCNE